MKYNNKIITKRYFNVGQKIIHNFMSRQAWTDGRTVSTICTDRTDSMMMKAYQWRESEVEQRRNM